MTGPLRGTAALGSPKMAAPLPARRCPKWRRGGGRAAMLAVMKAAFNERRCLMNGRLMKELPAEFPKKRKRSRWNQDSLEQKTVIPGMPTVIPPGLTREQERAYIGNAVGAILGRRVTWAVTWEPGGGEGGGSRVWVKAGGGGGGFWGEKRGFWGVGKRCGVLLWRSKRALGCGVKSGKIGVWFGVKRPRFGAAWR